MDKYTDEKLIERLKAYGQDVGPVNNSTRSYWLNALAKLKLKHGGSPTKCSSEKKVKKKTPLRHANRRNAKCRSRSVDSPKSANQSFSENDLSDWEINSILTDSPGSTPFPAKVSRKKKTASNQKISSSEAPPGKAKGMTSQKNGQKYLSMTPNSTRNSEEINIGYKSTRIQPTDGELREKLKEFGEHVQRRPMNEATRNGLINRLDKLMWGSSPVESNSDSEIMCPFSSGMGRRRIKRRNGSDFQNIDYEDSDYFKNPEESVCADIMPSDQAVHISKGHLSECLKLFLRFLLQGIFLITVFIVVVLLVSEFPTEDGQSEADV